MSSKLVAIIVGALLAAGYAHARVDPANLCKEGKNKAAGKKAYDILKAFGKNTKKSNSTKLAKAISRAQSKFYKGFGKADRLGPCPVSGDAVDVELAVDDCVDQVMTLIGGGGGGACQAFMATGQRTCWNRTGDVIACAGTGHDGEIQAGGTLAYIDNGDGTITDLNTGLSWQKQTDDDGLLDKDNTYTWDGAFAYVDLLNSGGGFGGHTDWRLPNVKELQSIVNYEVPYPGPAVSPAFDTDCTPGCSASNCSCTAIDSWSSTTYAESPAGAWLVYFFNGDVSFSAKRTLMAVRAVRGGL